MLSFSYLTSCTLIKSNLRSYTSISLTAILNESDLQRLLTLQVPNHMSIFCLCCSKSETLYNTLRRGFLAVRVFQPPAQPQSWRNNPYWCPQLLMQYIHSYPPYLQADSSIHNLRVCHATVTTELFNMVSHRLQEQNKKWRELGYYIKRCFITVDFGNLL